MKKTSVGSRFPANVPTISLNQSYLEVQGGGTFSVVVTRTGDLSYTSSVKGYTIAGTANGSDYDEKNGITIEFLPTEASKTITIATFLDVPPEGYEEFYFKIANPTNAKLGNVDLTLAIQPSAEFVNIFVQSISAPDITEGSSAVFTVTLNQAVPTGETRNIFIARTGTVASQYLEAPVYSNGVYVNPKNVGGSPIVVPAGVSQFTVTYATITGAAVGTFGTIILQVGSGTATAKVYPAVTPVTLNSITSPTVNEGQLATMTVTLSATTTQQLILSATIGSIDTTPNVHYVSPVSYGNGVTVNEFFQLVVPVGISSFTINVNTLLTDQTSGSRQIPVVLNGAFGDSVSGNVTINYIGEVVTNAVEIGANVGIETYYNSNFNFIDLMPRSVIWLNIDNSAPSFRTEDNRLVDMPAGASVKSYIIYDTPPNITNLRTGAITVTANTGVTITLSAGAGFSNVTNGVGSASCTLNPAGNPKDYSLANGYSLQVVITNNTGATISGETIVTPYFTADASDRTKGYITNARFRELMTNNTVVRWMDAANTNNQFMYSTSQLPNKNSKIWHDSAGSRPWHFVPYDVQGMAMIELYHDVQKGRDLHINLPCGNWYIFCNNSNATTDSFSTEDNILLTRYVSQNQQILVSPHYGLSYPTGITTGVYYADVSTGSLRLKSTIGGAIIDITEAGRGLCINSLNDPYVIIKAVLDQLYTVSHTINGSTYLLRNILRKLLVEVLNEPWNSNNAFKGFNLLFRGLSWMATGAVGNMQDALAWLMFKVKKALDDSGWTATGKAKQLFNMQVAYNDSVQPVLAKADTWSITGTGTVYNTCNPIAAIAPYNGHTRLDWRTNNAAFSLTDWYNEGALTMSDADFMKYVYASSDYTAKQIKDFKTLLRAEYPSIEITSYEADSHFENYTPTETNSVAVMARYRDLVRFNSTYSLANRNYYYNACFVANEIKAMVTYLHAGQWSDAPLPQRLWGEVLGTHYPDTATATWRKTHVPYGIDSASFVTSITNAGNANEGANIVFTVNCTAQGSAKTIPFALTGTFSQADIGLITASNGVEVYGLIDGILRIPAAVSSFTMTIPVVDDVTAEAAETVILTIGTQSSTANINLSDGYVAPSFANIFSLVKTGAIRYPDIETGFTSGLGGQEANVSVPIGAGYMCFDLTSLVTTGELDDTESVTFKFKAKTSIANVNGYSYQLWLTVGDASSIGTLSLSGAQFLGASGSYGAESTTTFTNNTGTNFNSATHKLILQINVGATENDTAHTYSIKELYKA